MDHFLLEFGVRASLIAAATGVVLRVTRVKTASARHTAWSGVLVLMMLLPIWTAWGPRVSWKVLPAPTVHQAASIGDAVGDPTPGSIGKTAASVGPVSSKGQIRPWDLWHFLIGIYVIGVGVLLLRLALGTIRAHLLIRRATACDGHLTSASCASPITVGWFRPVAILPEQWRQWPQKQLDAVLLHEREHMRRHDPLVQWLALLNRAVFWFHPLAWWLERQLSALAEEACDAVVLAGGHDPRDYSEYLLRMADSVMQSGRRVSLVGMAMPGSFLSRRIPRLFEAGLAPRISRMRMICTIAAFAVSSVTFAAGALEPREIALPPLAAPVVAIASAKVVPSQPAAAVQAAVPAPQPPQVAPPVAIDLDARIVTASKSFSREFGSRLGRLFEGAQEADSSVRSTSGIAFRMQPGSDARLDEILTAAETRGVAKVLSRSKIATRNHVAAQLSQGTQIPVWMTVDGVDVVRTLTAALKAEFLPQITDAGTILMTISVEGSQPDLGRAVNGIPSIQTWSAKSTVLMNNGGTAVLGGIYLDTADMDVRKVPGLGAMPVNRELQQTQPDTTMELLLFITPRIKAPQP